MRELPVLVISMCRYLVDAERMQLTRVDKPLDKIQLGIVPHQLHTDIMIYYDDKNKCRYFPSSANSRIPPHVSLYEFPALEFLDPVGYAIRSKAKVNMGELSKLKPDITIAIRHNISQQHEVKLSESVLRLRKQSLKRGTRSVRRRHP